MLHVHYYSEPSNVQSVVCVKQVYVLRVFVITSSYFIKKVKILCMYVCRPLCVIALLAGITCNTVCVHVLVVIIVIECCMFFRLDVPFRDVSKSELVKFQASTNIPVFAIGNSGAMVSIRIHFKEYGLDVKCWNKCVTAA